MIDRKNAKFKRLFRFRLRLQGNEIKRETKIKMFRKLRILELGRPALGH